MDAARDASALGVCAWASGTGFADGMKEGRNETIIEKIVSRDENAEKRRIMRILEK